KSLPVMKTTAERSRTGCGRCKTRRVKCDEAWPTCGRCARLRVSCTGPALQVRWSNKHELHRTSNREAGIRTPIEPRTQPAPASQPIALDHDENQSSCVSVSEMDFADLAFHDYSLLPDLDEPETWINDAFSPIAASQTLVQCPESNASPLGSSSLTPSEYSHRSQEAPPLNTIADYGTKLVEFYFKDAASIMTVFDGNLNPFRTVIARLWTSSNLLYLTIKSLSAVFLSNIYPQMAAIGVNLRREAISILVGLKQDEMDEKDLLALFMIGGTASWFDADDIGQEHFSIMIKSIQRMTASGQIASSSNNRHFFKDMLVCWRMFLAFIDDNATSDEDDDDLRLGLDIQPSHRGLHQSSSLDFPTLHVPHPLTGVASGAQIYLIKIGRLVRRNRRLIHDRKLDWTNRATVNELDGQLKEAERLESELFKLRVPSVEEIVDTGDAKTPTWHLATLANVYRHVGLLLLYRVFSDTRVTARHRSRKGPSNRSTRLESNERDESTLETPRETDNNDAEWLRSLALRIVAALSSIPIDSGTKDFHPFLLVAVSSDLPILVRKQSKSSIASDYTNRGRHHNHSHGHEEVYQESQELPPSTLDVHDARAFVLSRLQSLQSALPRRPVKRCIDLVKAVWDSQGEDLCSFWMDVMMLNNWETFMA
ncbi:hypothetical protein CC79DRAFT_1265864, partial [Sarocladium strictum]